jgi:putative addiction module antidote
MYYVERAMIDIPQSPDTEGVVLQIRKIGNSLGLILSKDLLARLKLKEGDRLHIVEQTERGLKLSPYDPKHAKAMEIARRSFRSYADTYKALAK